ncbi:hypothetical protein [Acidithiobacillus caldus]|uniref:hypothetical protein n=1 Tax=Acidithiobacillus caldus TaxID=33059 RepID=UPI00129B5535|nr:hypothetical protein [Acidithiobacillus caldus]MBU2736405.1 hypothetical protein [Acidithiobacillus caldus ATCC 51756]MBU2743982.1 hypothetical protein [Acidithiobacillus caldus]
MVYVNGFFNKQTPALDVVDNFLKENISPLILSVPIAINLMVAGSFCLLREKSKRAISFMNLSIEEAARSIIRFSALAICTMLFLMVVFRKVSFVMLIAIALMVIESYVFSGAILSLRLEEDPPCRQSDRDDH